MQIELEPAFILHARPYRDTSLLVNFFSRHFGRMSAVIRGVRKSKSSKRNILNPFQHLLISFQGKGELKLVTQFELAESLVPLEGRFLLSGFYLNELLMRLLPEQDAHENLFHSYKRCLNNLANQCEIESTLRSFELELLRDLGYVVSFDTDAITELAINPNDEYCLNVNEGFIAVDRFSMENNMHSATLKKPSIFRGSDILAISRGDFSSVEVLLAAKKITRILMHPHLGDKPLVSRELFIH